MVIGLGWYPEDLAWRTVNTEMSDMRTTMYMIALRLVLLRLNIYTMSTEIKLR